MSITWNDQDQFKVVKTVETSQTYNLKNLKEQVVAMKAETAELETIVSDAEAAKPKKSLE